MATLKQNYNFMNKSINDIVDFGKYGIKKWNGHIWETDLSSSTEALVVSGGTMTGAIAAIREVKIAMDGNNIDLNLGNLFTKTISAATTLTISNALPADAVNSFILELKNAGSFPITYFPGITWDGGTVPILTQVGIDILGFYSYDGGTVWRGMVLSKDSK